MERAEILVRESETSVEDETKILSWVCGTEWAVVNFSELLLEANDKVTDSNDWFSCH